MSMLAPFSFPTGMYGIVVSFLLVNSHRKFIGALVVSLEFSSRTSGRYFFRTTTFTSEATECACAPKTSLFAFSPPIIFDFFRDLIFLLLRICRVAGVRTCRACGPQRRRQPG